MILTSSSRPYAALLSLVCAVALPGVVTQAASAQDQSTPAPLASPSPESTAAPIPSPSPAAKPSAAPEPKHHASGALSEDDEKTLATYHITLEKISQYRTVSKIVAAAAKKDPELKKELRGAGALHHGKSIEETVTDFEAQCPHAATAIKGAGMTVRDYTLTGLSLTNALAAAGNRRASASWARPKYIPADNVQIAEQNQTLLEAMMRDLAKSAREE